MKARCLDGSPVAYYIRPATAMHNATKYVVYFQGGGWCYGKTVDETLFNCAMRSATALGSSLHYPPTTGDKGGILTPDKSFNPDFGSWNAVWVPYCDGGAWSGNRAEPVHVPAANKTLHFRGRANMHAVVSDLLARRGMASATHVVMDGGSAGGLTTLLHADFFGSLLPPTARFGAIGDAGWFLPDPKLDFGGVGVMMRNVHTVQNATANAGMLLLLKKGQSRLQ